MKLLKIENDKGWFLDNANNYQTVDQINRQDLLRLVGATLSEVTAEFDSYDEAILKNHAHQVVYKSIVGKLEDLAGRRQAFTDDSKRLFLSEYERYKIDLSAT